jgi:tetratricopeptide (TPR) repeat protein
MLSSCDRTKSKREEVDYSESLVRSLLSRTQDLTIDTLESASFLQAVIKTEAKDSSNLVAYYGVLGNVSAKHYDRLNPHSESYYQHSVELAEKENLPIMRVWSLVNYGYYFYNFRQTERALPFFMEAVFLIDTLGEESVILPEDTFRKLGFFFGTIGNYEDAISYLEKGDRYATMLTPKQRAMLLDNLGQYHLYNQDTTKALDYFLQAESLAAKSKDYVRYGKALGNIALVYLGRGNYKEALTLINKDLDYSEAHNSAQNTMYAQVLKARILLKMDSVSGALEMLKKAEVYANSKTYLKKDLLEINRLKLDIAVRQNEEREELLIRRKLEVLEGLVAEMDGERALLQNKWQVDKEKKQRAILELESDYQTERYSRIVLSSLIILIGLGVLAIFIHLKRSAKAREIQYEKTVVELQLRKVAAEKKLLVARETLESYKDYLTEKNRQIDELQQMINGSGDSKSYYLEKEKGLLKEILDSHLLTDENWTSFKRSFDTTYPNFYLNLKHEFPELTDSNMRYIILSKLGLSVTEISNLLGISTESVKKSRQRLKKKMGNRFREFEQAIYL